jgi:hypothetical protein
VNKDARDVLAAAARGGALTVATVVAADAAMVREALRVLQSRPRR